MKYSNIIFDLDGTLIDSIYGICFSLNHALKLTKINKRISTFELAPWMGEPILTILSRVIPEISEEQATTILTRFREHYNRIGWKKSQLFPFVNEQLQLLIQHNAHLFIATNKQGMITSTLLTHFGIRNLFEDVFSPDIYSGKILSKSELVEMIISKFNLRKSQTLMVGDAKTDCLAARDCGIIFAYATYGYGDLSDQNDLVNSYKIDHIYDLSKIIED